MRFLVFAAVALSQAGFAQDIPAGIPIAPQGEGLTRAVAVQLFLQRNPAPTIRVTLGSDTLLRFPHGRQISVCTVGNNFINLVDSFGRNLVTGGGLPGAEAEKSQTREPQKLIYDVNLHVAPPAGATAFPGSWFNCKFSNGEAFVFNVVVTTKDPYAQVYFREGSAPEVDADMDAMLKRLPHIDLSKGTKPKGEPQLLPLPPSDSDASQTELVLNEADLAELLAAANVEPVYESQEHRAARGKKK